MQMRDLQLQYDKYKQEIDSAIQGVLLRADFIEGKEVKELEEQLANYVGVKNCITCANGTEAMTLVMMAWGIKEGDAFPEGAVHYGNFDLSGLFRLRGVQLHGFPK